MPIDKISAQDARLRFDASRFYFETTAELDELDVVIGQDKAVDAIAFALRMQRRHFNLFVAGAPGTGRASLVPAMAEEFAAEQPTPTDWCYVCNFDNEDEPTALQLPAGHARPFAKAIKKAIDNLEKHIPNALATVDFRRQHESIIDRAYDRRHILLDALNAQAVEHKVKIEDDAQSLHIVPLLEDGTAMPVEDLRNLTDDEKKHIERIERLMRDDLLAYIAANRETQAEVDDQLSELEASVVRAAVAPELDRVRERYPSDLAIGKFLSALKDDIVDNFRFFLPIEPPPSQQLTPDRQSSPNELSRYEVNVIVDNAEGHGAPVVVEANPTHVNLIGRVERKMAYGALETDHTLIKPGAVHRANGGVLIVNANDLLTTPFAYHALKRVLRDGACTIEEPDVMISSTQLATIRPQPIPLQLKLILLGTLEEYIMLNELDEQFASLVKVRADFGRSTDLNDEVADQFARFVADQAKELELHAFNADAVAAVIELASRWAGRQDEVSLRMASISDLLLEADHWCRDGGATIVDRAHVEEADRRRLDRGSLMHERLLAEFRRGTLLVDVRGRRVGQVNGLAVVGVDSVGYGMPCRITARTFAGSTGVVNIERESELSGQIHSKAVLILTGYLSGTYAVRQPLAFAASLTYEQNYSIIDGDSASMAELVAILSSLAGLDVRQDIAITGSMSQYGEAQPIGGVNEKIEGFFDVCAIEGLSGTQGCVIPSQNRNDLNLANRVVDAIAAGQFHVWCVDSADEAIEVLLQRQAGSQNADGSFPVDSVHGIVSARLLEMHEASKDGADNSDK